MFADGDQYFLFFWIYQYLYEQ
ncbi:conserved protein of unknown function [Ectopseudomonas oleovorans]|uniref:Uncharacterized protein n=1 Tax=Ectopseudomonas oleovorans TaxID=301 RepID=A0A653B922_ECTOL|nr:conserved protein of unknown function [Pseudomonas oleovorans]